MILLMSDWWSTLDLVEKIYWGISIPFSVLFLIQLVLTFVGGDFDDVSADGDPDAVIDGD